MFRQYISITLVLSLIGVGFSGILMLILSSFSFQMQMHPVHKIFGIIMVIAGGFHMVLNLKSLKKYLSNKKVLILGITMFVFLIFLTIVGLNKQMDAEIVDQIQLLMSQMGAK